MIKVLGLALAAMCALGFSGETWAADGKRFNLELEVSPVWQSTNNARIPNSGGTKFSLRDIQGSGPFAGGRVSLSYAPSEKHELRLMAAPLSITKTGELQTPVFFAGESFAAGPDVQATYRFNSYRLTYRYRIFSGDRWTWKLGVTGKVRDAKIELDNGALVAVDDDLGFVPLLHLDGECKLGKDWKFGLNVDGLGAPQGRALDISLKALYDISKNLTAGFGYRMLEGGADVDRVYTFAWLHYATASIAYRF